MPCAGYDHVPRGSSVATPRGGHATHPRVQFALVGDQGPESCGTPGRTPHRRGPRRSHRPDAAVGSTPSPSCGANGRMAAGTATSGHPRGARPSMSRSPRRGDSSNTGGRQESRKHVMRPCAPPSCSWNTFAAHRGGHTPGVADPSLSAVLALRHPSSAACALRDAAYR
jgi:hypothetical protein